MNRDFVYPRDISTGIFRQSQYDEMNSINEEEEEEDSSDVIFMGQSGPIEPIMIDETTNDFRNEMENKPQDETSNDCDDKENSYDDKETNTFDDEMFIEIKKIIYNPEKLQSILHRLKGVDPNDPIFSEFYNHENTSKS